MKTVDIPDYSRPKREALHKELKSMFKKKKYDMHDRNSLINHLQ